MTTAGEIMTPDPQCIGVNDSLLIAASLMADLDVGVLPICGEDSKLKGMLTDRDIVVGAVAAGMDLETTPASRLAQGKPVTVKADEEISVALDRMQKHGVRRLPVMAKRMLVGIISQGDIVRALALQTARPVHSISL